MSSSSYDTDQFLATTNQIKSEMVTKDILKQELLNIFKYLEKNVFIRKLNRLRYITNEPEFDWVVVS